MEEFIISYKVSERNELNYFSRELSFKSTCSTPGGKSLTGSVTLILNNCAQTPVI